MFAKESFIPFAQELYRQFEASHGNSNFFMSPLSIYSALSLVLAGSATETRKELLSALRAPSGDINTICKSLGEGLQMITGGENDKFLLQANAVFIQQGGNILTQYIKLVTDYFKGISKELNFESDPDGSRNTINDWISEQTKEKISDLLPSGSITPLTRLVLANAIYFKGTWKAKFDPKLTKPNSTFHTLSKGDVKVSMMERKGRYPLADFVDLKVRALKIPFECYHMLVVLPEETNGLPAILKSFSENLASFSEVLTTDQYFETEVILKIPKFHLGSGMLQMKQHLSAMGMPSIFDCKSADFTGITGDRSLCVSDVFHQAVIDIDEEGAEAAAATAIPMMMRCMPRPPPEFVVDHPFIFFIVNNAGLPVFMGHVVDPELK